MVIVEEREFMQVEFGNNWVVDVIDNRPQGTKEFWLYHKEYGIKSMMFGIMAHETEVINYLIDDIAEVSKEYRRQYIGEFIEEGELK